MAKKVVATLQSGKGKSFAKVITMQKSGTSGAYSFKEMMVHVDHVDDYFKQK